MGVFLEGFEALCRRIVMAAITSGAGDWGERNMARIQGTVASVASACFTWPEFEAARLAMIEEPETLRAVTSLPTHGVAGANDQVALYQVAQQFSEHYLSETASTRWSNPLYRSLQSELAKSLATNEMHVVIASSVVGAELRAKAGWLALDISVGLPSVYERMLINDLSETRGYIYPNALVRLHCFVSRESPVMSALHEDPVGPERNRLRDATRALRLALGGNVRSEGLYIYPAAGTLVGLTGLRPRMLLSPQSDGWNHNGAPNGAVDRKQITAAAGLLKRISAAGDHARVAMHRYDYSAERVSDEDRLIDSVIGLEALLLPLISAELSFRFAIHGGWLLGDSPSERLAHFNALQGLYRIRSQVVHGEPVTLAELRDAPAAAVGYLRLVLRAYLERGEYDLKSWSDWLKQRAMGI